MDAPACTEPKLGGARGRSELTEQAENKKKKNANGERTAML